MSLIRSKVKKALFDNSGFFETYISERMPYSRYVRKTKRRYPEIGSVKLPKSYERRIAEFWRDNYGLRVDTAGYKYFYSANGVENVYYIPEDVFFKYIIRKLNQFAMVKAYADKNAYNKFFSEVQTPRTVIRNINGRFFDQGYSLVTRKDAVMLIVEAVSRNKVIIKPSIDSGGGKNISLIDMVGLQLSPSEIETKIDAILAHYGQDYIVQDYFTQSKMLTCIYPYSVNTLRIITFDNNQEIKVLARVLKMGNKGSFMDKVSMGGLSCGLNEEGYLHEHAFTADVRTPVNTHPQSHFKFKGARIPNFEDVLCLTRQLHAKIRQYFRFVSWDMTLDQDNNPVLMEVNLRNQGIMLPQLNCGPLFGAETDEVLRKIFQSH